MLSGLKPPKDSHAATQNTFFRRTVPYRTVQFFSSTVFVLTVFDVGDPAEAELYAGLDEAIVGGSITV
jgi:hypothetical protein